MNNKENYKEKWDAIAQEMNAHANKISAEQRMEYNKVMEDFSKEVDAGTDWLEADWNQFRARVKKWWNEFQIKTNQTVRDLNN